MIHLLEAHVKDPLAVENHKVGQFGLCPGKTKLKKLPTHARTHQG